MTSKQSGNLNNMNDTALVKLDAARHALAECKTAMEAKSISDVAEAARVYLERTNASAETVNRATEIRLLAERQMGAFLKEMPSAAGRPKNNSETELISRPATLAEIGITPKQSMTAQQLADIPSQEFHERIALVKAGGEKLTTAKIVAKEFSPRAKAASEEAAGDSEKLWSLKSIWKHTNKRDRAAFLAWAQHDEQT